MTEKITSATNAEARASYVLDICRYGATVKLTTLLFIDRNMPYPESFDLPNGQFTILSARQPEVLNTTHNEDSAAIITIDENRSVLAIADGCGGHRAGELASRTALQTLAAVIKTCLDNGDDLRNAILNGIEEANQAVMALNLGAMTTLSVLEVCGNTVRPYHIGDSPILVISKNGNVRFQTLAHAPTAYALEAGLLNEQDALSHSDRHVVSNLVGSSDMRIEIGSSYELAPRDTVILASDGLFDNLLLDEITERARKGALADVVADLAETSRTRMLKSDLESSHADDLTMIAFRPAAN